MQNSKTNIALVLDSADNVATLLSDTDEGDSIILKGSEKKLRTAGPIEIGHKIALSPINKGEDIIKYGQRIGIATAGIKPGEWIHLHNMESVYDKEFKKRII